MVIVDVIVLVELCELVVVSGSRAGQNYLTAAEEIKRANPRRGTYSVQ